MKGVIVLEGPDGAGKTTLAAHIAREHRAQVIHLSWYGEHRDVGRRRLAQVRRAARLAQDSLVVLDRAWPSEDVYGPIFRGESATAARGRMEHRVLLKHAALYVICLPPKEVCLETFARKKAAGQEMFDRVGEVWDRYAEWLLRTRLSSIQDHELTYLDLLSERSEEPSPFWPFQATYDWTTHGQDLGSFTEELTKQLESLRCRQWPQALNPWDHNLAGYLPTARVLLVGDRPGPRANGAGWPFVDALSEDRGCSSWLSRQLTEAGIFEEHLFWTNAHGGRDQLPELDSYGVLERLQVVALGQTAVARLRELGHEPDLALPHPQWWKRFKHHDPGYLKPLQAALRSV